MFCICAVSAQAQTNMVEEVRKVHGTYCLAVEKKDSALLQELFHDDMIVTSGSGARRNKSQEMADALDANYPLNYFRSRDLQLVAVDNTVVVAGDLYWEITVNGKLTLIERRVTFTYVKSNNRWKIIAQHIGRIPAATSQR
jgi:ketosteroid isomerase-like protein